MKNRQLSPVGDYQFGKLGAWLVNSSEAVAQAIRTRLALWAGEWFLDTEEGTPYFQQILGTGTQDTRDIALRQRILTTPGVKEILSYQSSVTDRKLVVYCLVETDYGVASLTTTLG